MRVPLIDLCFHRPLTCSASSSLSEPSPVRAAASTPQRAFIDLH